MVTLSRCQSYDVLTKDVVVVFGMFGVVVDAGASGLVLSRREEGEKGGGGWSTRGGGLMKLGEGEED